jgi:ATPase subunit of ABC transporter with duplicated ATPase domains
MTATEAPQQDSGATEPTAAVPVVTVEHLRKTYANGVGVQDVSFSVGRGEIFGIIGPNGAGKTTTVECISGMRTPESGVISVLGLDPQTDRAAIRERVGVQLQESQLQPFVKVGEVLDLFASFYRQPADQVLTTLPEVTEVGHEGQRMRVTGTGDLVSAVIRALEAAGVQARDMQVESATLDDAYVQLTHHREEAVRP